MFICGAGGWWPANSGLLYLGWFDSFIFLALPTSISVAFPSFDVCSPCQAWTISLACSFRMSCLPSSLGYQMFPHFHGWGRGNDNLEANGSQRHCFFMILIYFHFDLFRHWRNMKKPVGTCYYQPPIHTFPSSFDFRSGLRKLCSWRIPWCCGSTSLATTNSKLLRTVLIDVADRFQATAVVIDGQKIDRIKVETVDSADPEVLFWSRSPAISILRWSLNQEQVGDFS